MAFTVRTINQIFQELLAEKQNLTRLDGLLDNGITDEDTLISKLNSGDASEWVLWLYNQAVHTHLTDLATQSGIEDIKNELENKITPTAQWYVNQAKLFQYGDTLTIDPDTYKPKYDTLNESNQIIESCTTLELQNRLNLKVKRVGGTLLTSDELNSFQAYMNKIKAAGTQVEIENYDSDKVILNAEVIYNASKNKNTIQSDVETVVNEYLSNLRFDSKFITSDLEKKIFDEVEGVRDFRFNESTATNALGTSINFLHEYQSLAGWAEIDPANPLSSTITYTAK